MHIVVDIREACNSRRTGKGEWTDAFTRALIRRTIPVLLLTDAPLPEGFPRPPHVTIRRIPGHGLRWHLAAAMELRRLGTSVRAVISPTSFVLPALLGRAMRVFPVVHDLIAFRPGAHERRARWIERLTLPRTVRTAACVFTLSDATRTDLLEHFPRLDPGRAVTIGAGPVHTGPVQSHEGTSILCIGTLCPRKNQRRLIAAYAQLPVEIRRRHPLVLAGGRGWHDDAILDAAQRTEGVRIEGYVSREAVEHLYADALILAFPSLYEGFGFPVLTAMQRGIPVLTSNRGSLAEVAGDAASIAPPDDVDALHAALERLLTDASLRHTLREKGLQHQQRFSWDAVVDRALEAMERR